MDSLDDRVTALEHQLHELTGRPVSPAAGDEAFWVLDGIRERGAAGAGAVLAAGTVDLPTGEHYDWQYGSAVGDLFALDWTEFAATLTALGHPVRLLVLRTVLAGARDAAELAAADGLAGAPRLHHHLRQLVAAGWLAALGDGRYAVPAERVVPLLAILSSARH